MYILCLHIDGHVRLYPKQSQTKPKRDVTFSEAVNKDWFRCFMHHLTQMSTQHLRVTVTNSTSVNTPGFDTTELFRVNRESPLQASEQARKET